MTSDRSGHNLALGPGPEFDRIRRIIERVPGAHGLGDDCGVFPHGGEFIALSTDVSVEGVHFRLDWIDAEEVGWRATAAALSDLAAEGAQPIGILAAVTMPADAPERELLDLMSGVGAAAKYAGAEVLGGDLSAGSVWSVTVTAVGRAESPVTRQGAVPGNRLWVTGVLGGTRAALDAWQHGKDPLPGARGRFAHPEPRIEAGVWLAQRGARAMIDLSDGLAGDVSHLAAASNVAITIDLDALPIAAEALAQARQLDTPVQHFAAEGGEDYELLVALPREFDDASGFTRACGLPLTLIGVVAEGSGVRFLMSGAPVELQGYNHFR
jgi:thiamine-monophosphate kinase